MREAAVTAASFTSTSPSVSALLTEPAPSSLRRPRAETAAARTIGLASPLMALESGATPARVRNSPSA